MRIFLVCALLLLTVAPLSAQDKKGAPGPRELPVPTPTPRSARVERKQHPAPWHPADNLTQFEATENKRPLVILITDDIDTKFADGDEMRTLADESAIFVLISRDNAEPAANSDQIVPPRSKFLSANPTEAYGVKDGEWVLICDWFGNEYFRTRPSIRPDDLQLLIAKIPERVESMEERLQKKVERGRRALEKDDFKACLKAIARVYDDEMWNFKATHDACDLYTTLKYTVRREVRRLRDSGDTEELDQLLGIFQKTDQNEYIRTAIKRAQEIKVSPEQEEDF